MEEYFDVLYKNYFPRVQDYLSRFTGRDEAQDLTQEVFIKVYNSLSTFKGESEVSTWIFRIARNLAIDRSGARERRTWRANPPRLITFRL